MKWQGWLRESAGTWLVHPIQPTRSTRGLKGYPSTKTAQYRQRYVGAREGKMKYCEKSRSYPFFLAVLDQHERNGGCITPDNAPAVAGHHLLRVCREADKLKMELGKGWSITSIYTPGGVAGGDSGAFPWRTKTEYSQDALSPDIPRDVLRDIEEILCRVLEARVWINPRTREYRVQETTKGTSPIGGWKTY